MNSTILLCLLLFLIVLLFLADNNKDVVANCLVTDRKVQDMLNSIKRGCVKNLYGVIREYMINAEQLQDFYKSGNNRLVIVTNVEPDIFVNNTEKVDFVAMSSNIINDEQMYLVLGIKNGKVYGIQEPTENFVDAFISFEKAIRNYFDKNNDANTFVYLIKEN